MTAKILARVFANADASDASTRQAQALSQQARQNAASYIRQSDAAIRAQVEGCDKIMMAANSRKR